MIDVRFIEDYSRRQQTTKDNVVREYCQHLFLAKFYQQEDAEKILFKGGTCLRVVWHSPRFSEDLDFQGFQLGPPEIENILAETLAEMEREGLTTEIREAKKTSGGYLGKISCQWGTLATQIQVEVSLRKKNQKVSMAQALIQNDFIPPYTLLYLAEGELIQEKINALLTRGKPRDFFDLYFILRSRLSFKSILAKQKNLKQSILVKLTQSKLDFARELKQFLPASHHNLLKNFNSTLEKEIQRILP